MKFRFSAIAVLVFSALMCLSCRGALEHHPGKLQVTLALSDSTLEVVDTRDVGELDNPPVETEALSFVFRPADGSVDVEGQIADTRILRSEWDENGQADPKLVVAGTGLFEVRLPYTAGELELITSDGESLGVVAVDPEAPVTTRSALYDSSDILSPPVKILDHGSSSSKVDILFLSEGYRSSDMSQYRSHVASIVNKLARHEAYRPYMNRFNVWRQEVRSSSRSIGSNGRPRDTAFETSSGISGVDRCVFFANSEGYRAARELGDQVDAEVVIVLANRTQTGACARGGLIVTSRPSHVSETVAHEIGHALFGLMDEYDTPRPNGLCMHGPNVARSLNSIPWSDMLTTNQLPTSTSARSGTIGAFRGAGYCRNRYRPAHDCLMRTLGKPLCPVCKREAARKMANYTAGTRNTSSSGSSGSGSSSSSSTNTSIASPRSLSPDGVVVSSTEVRLEWGRVSGASNYKVAVQRQSSGSWQTFGNVETSGTVARVTVQESGGQYRWTVRACSSAGCSTETSAQFAYGTSSSGGTSSGGTSSGGSTGAAGAPSVPTSLRPSTGSTVSDETPSLSWGAVSGASHYQFKMVWHDGTSWKSYVPAQSVNSSRVSTTLREPEKWYGFAVQACNSAGCSDWTEFSTMYFRP